MKPIKDKNRSLFSTFRSPLSAFLLGSLLAAGCFHNSDTEVVETPPPTEEEEIIPVKEFEFSTVSGERCFLQTNSSEFLDEPENTGLRNKYDVIWPEEGVLTPSAERELLYAYFGDSSNFQRASERWLSDVMFTDESDIKSKRVSRLADTLPMSYSTLLSSCTVNNDIAIIQINSEGYMFGAAHGFYSVDYKVVDIQSGRILHLSDLVDNPSRLTKVLGRAVKLPDNKEMYQNLIDEGVSASNLPLGSTFFIDASLGKIVLVYQPYEIMSYAAGLQHLELPVRWLSEQVELTPYAKQLFGF